MSRRLIKGSGPIYIYKSQTPFLLDSITAKPLNRSWRKWYHMKALLMLCVYSHESWWSDPHHQHQGPKGVCHVPPGGLGDHLKGYMGYQPICWASQMQNILLIGTWHLHHQYQGPKGVGHVHLGPLGNHLQGHFGVSVDLLWLPDAEYLIW